MARWWMYGVRVPDEAAVSDVTRNEGSEERTVARKVVGRGRRIVNRWPGLALCERSPSQRHRERQGSTTRTGRVEGARRTWTNGKKLIGEVILGHIASAMTTKDWGATLVRKKNQWVHRARTSVEGLCIRNGADNGKINYVLWEPMGYAGGRGYVEGEWNSVEDILE